MTGKAAVRHLQGEVWDCLRAGPPEGLSRPEIAALVHIEPRAAGCALQGLKKAGRATSDGKAHASHWKARGTRPADRRGTNLNSLRNLEISDDERASRLADTAARIKYANELHPVAADGGCELQRCWNRLSCDHNSEHRATLGGAGYSARPQETQQAAD